MNKMIDYDSTVNNFVDSAISFLNGMPFRGEKYEKQKDITLRRMQNIKRDPKKYTTKREIYSNMAEFMGFIEYDVIGVREVVNNDVYYAVISVLDAIGQYYEIDYMYTQEQLLKALKKYNIAINRKKLLKQFAAKMAPVSYFASKISAKQK